MIKIVTIVGARPQFVKAAAVSRAFNSAGGILEIIVHTGQHFDKNMSEVFFDEMEIPQPRHNLAIHSLSHGAMTGRMMEAIEEVLLKEKPDYLMVYGDTNSTLAGALAAKKLHIKVIHVEAGLRSFNMKMPEEVNRILTDRMSDLLFCPTKAAVKNLKAEGFDNFECAIFQCGDVMEDAARYYELKTKGNDALLKLTGLKSNDFYLCTLHRAENTDSKQRLAEIVQGLNRVAENHTVVLPIHPRTKNLIKEFSLHEGIMVIDPVGYLDMIQLIQHARMVVTDSGGLQKEAYFFDKFCVTMRDETEWVELVEHEFNKLVGAVGDSIYSAVQYFENQTFVRSVELFGGGNAAGSIAQEILARSK